ncbi:hypothetical protein V5N11_003385 [Cardamine amara subsp. amara]|uniref:Reverse transcriptase zinc-binding domain-containing protein n=1 Tax=Cardamine amara subsp. amara TaxID=228776 RepID=A0ABD0ZDT4_CARAN
MECDIGDGKSASFWFDNWSDFGSLIDYIGEEGPSRLGVPADACVAHAATEHGWRLPSSKTRCPRIQSLRNYLLSKSPPEISRGPDFFAWDPKDNQRSFFSTKRTWEILQLVAPRLPWTKAVLFTFWTTHLDRLPVNSRVLAWGMNIDSHCGFCSQHIETREHQLLYCEYSKQVWNFI